MPINAVFKAVPNQQAINFLRKKLNVSTEAWDDLKKEAHAKAFTVAGATKLDLLKDLRTAVDKAISEGESYSQFLKRFDDIVAEHGWEYKGKRGWRSRVIYDTNMRTAAMAGKWKAIQDNKVNRPYLMYRTAGDGRVRAKHQDWNKLILPVDDPFWKTHYPPNGWGCRCGVRTVSERDLERKGWKVGKSPKIEKSARINPGTGEYYGEVPEGIDTGWDYNVGSAWLDGSAGNDLKDYPKRIQDQFKDMSTTIQDAVKVAPSALSTVKGVGAAEINDVLVGLDKSQDQVKLLAEFMADKGIKTVIVKQAEMGFHNKSASRISGQVSDYLDNGFGKQNYTIRKAKAVGGFTSASFNHVVVKGSAGQAVKRNELQAIQDDLLETAKTVLESSGKWTVSSASTLPAAQVVLTWIHEIGHQVHFWAGSPTPSAQLPRLTQYSKANKYEYHAEHFVLWLVDREALHNKHPKIAKYFDNLIDTAMQSKVKKP